MPRGRPDNPATKDTCSLSKRLYPPHPPKTEGGDTVRFLVGLPTSPATIIELVHRFTQQWTLIGGKAYVERCSVGRLSGVLFLQIEFVFPACNAVQSIRAKCDAKEAVVDPVSVLADVLVFDCAGIKIIFGLDADR
eukprot:CAMPEP_0198112562 /NCGR_PEP_ID=MMETSP1442-20131203/4397_1 /TAXON_ID= /ORGANISM="Craspedostauros australis, Strain CCMP3328" /LENGTH=135 /DNA_ID=CAMNT_0043769377 /DNA_START=186 /DNA_END=590 /DNA_ORIENTATION=+